jgi:hypothetical protein
VIYVSAQRGNDANAGTFAAPYREISKAILQASTGNTILVLDGGDYAQFTVNKSVTIVAEGVLAEVSAAAAAFGNTAVTVNAAATDVVVLRGLTIKGTGGTVGISFSSGKELHVEKCTISNFVSTPDGFPGYGIQVNHGLLTVEHTILRDNTSGINFSSAPDARGIIHHCRIEGNGNPNGIGIQIGAGVQVTVTGSLVSGHADQGIYIRGAAGSPIPLLTLTDTVITHNRIGIYADRTGQVHLTTSTVTLNSTGVFTLNNGVIYTAGNNSVIGNLVANFAGGANVVFFKSDITS